MARWSRRLLRLSPVSQVCGLVGAALLLWVVGDTLLVRPGARHVRELQERTRAAAREVALLRGEGEPEPPITPEERELFARIDARLAERFPPEGALPRALDAVARLARAKGLELELIRLETLAEADHGVAGGLPGALPAVPELSVGRKLAPHRVALRLRLVHPYGRLVELLEGLEMLPVLLTVKSLEMQRAGRRVATELTLVGFRLEG